MNQSDLIELDPKEARRIGAESLIGYGKIFFPRTFRQPSSPMHEAIGAALYGPKRYNAFEIFRDAAKTSMLRVFTSQRIAYGISKTIMYVSVSQPHAVFSLRWLKRQVEYNRKWAQCFGLRKGTKWTDEWIEIIQSVPNEEGTTDEVIVTILAAGITGQIRGFNIDDFRPDLIVIDDILNEENTNTPEQRKKIDALLFGALLNSLAPASEAPWAKAVFLQTPFHNEDAIEKCMKDPQWNPLRFGCFDEKGESRWPARYPTAQLNADKHSAILRGQLRLWMREKECKIVSGEDKAIDVTKFKIYEILPEALDVVISIDPASSDSKKADHHAIVSLGFAGNDVYVIAYGLSKGTMPDKAANDFFTLAMLKPPRKAYVETIAYQRILKWYLEQEMIKRRIFIAIDAIQDKRSKATRIMQAFPGLVAFGFFHVKKDMTELIEQADDYDPQVEDQEDDLLDAIATAITGENPAIRAGITLEGEYTKQDDDERYPELEFGGAP